MFSPRASLVLLAVAATAVAACAGRTAISPPTSTSVTAQSAVATTAITTAKKKKATPTIQHVVLLIQENRSFDNMFNGYPGANTQNYGMMVPSPSCLSTPVPGTTPVAVPLQPINLETTYDLSHDRDNWVANYDNGNMDGFNRNCPSSPQPSPYPQYAYVPQAETQPYWSMAAQYVLADNMFQSNIDGSFVAHQYLIASQANREVDYPNGAWGCSQSGVTVHQLKGNPNLKHLLSHKPPVLVCQDYKTLADELALKNLTWSIYSVQGPPKFGETIASDWNGFQAINHIYNSSTYASHYVENPAQIISDVGSGTLANMTWVTPTVGNSDHPGFGGFGGPAWITSVVNAIGESQFWDSTVIFVVWDDWGGLYDHVAPPQVDFDGLGFRVPLMIISAYSPQGVIAHQQLEFGSILRYVENNWGLKPLAPSDRRATPVDKGCTPSVPCINTSASPRPFQPFSGTIPKSMFLRATLDTRPLDTQ